MKALRGVIVTFVVLTGITACACIIISGMYLDTVAGVGNSEYSNWTAICKNNTKGHRMLCLAIRRRLATGCIGIVCGSLQLLTGIGMVVMTTTPNTFGAYFLLQLVFAIALIIAKSVNEDAAGFNLWPELKAEQENHLVNVIREMLLFNLVMCLSTGVASSMAYFIGIEWFGNVLPQAGAKEPGDYPKVSFNPIDQGGYSNSGYPTPAYAPAVQNAQRPPLLPQPIAPAPAPPRPLFPGQPPYNNATSAGPNPYETTEGEEPPRKKHKSRKRRQERDNPGDYGNNGYNFPG